MEERNDLELKVPWSNVDLILIFIVTIISVMIIGEVMDWVLFKDYQAGVREAMLGLLGTLLQDSILLGLSIYLIKRKYNFSFRENLFQVRKKAEVIFNGIAGGVAILFGVTVVNLIMAMIVLNLFNYTPTQQKIIELLMNNNNPLLFASYAVLIVVIAPFVEELFFRGLVYTYLRGLYGIKVGILVSSMLFGLVHMSLWAFVGTFLGGVGLAYLFEKSKSLYTSVIAHMVWNGIVTGLVYLAQKYSNLVIQ